VDSCLPLIRHNEIAWSSNYCVYLLNTDLNVDSLVLENWLHDWNPDYDDIYEQGR
jgi:hypothetical protein